MPSGVLLERYQIYIYIYICVCVCVCVHILYGEIWLKTIHHRTSLLLKSLNMTWCVGLDLSYSNMFSNALLS